MHALMTFFLQLLEAAKAADDASLRWVNGFVGQAPLFDTLMIQLVHSDLFKVGVLVSMLYWLWFRTDGDVARRRHQVMMAIPCAAVAIALLLGTPFFLVFGWLSDKIGRKPIIMLGCVLAALTYFPVFKALTAAANPQLAAAVASAHPSGARHHVLGVGPIHVVRVCVRDW